MTMRSPPALATWLLLRLGSRYYTESLAGDLWEQYQNGRSRCWYWRQVALSILLARTRPLRSAVLKIVDAIIAILAVLALGVGSFAWANVVKHPPGICPQTCASALQAEPADCGPARRGR